MKTLNRVFLFGNLGKSPELMTSKNGKSFARLSLATNRMWNGSDGQRAEKTDWHQVMVWGSLADLCARHLQKGSQVLVEGTIDQWNADEEDGTKKYGTSITAKEVTFAGRAAGSAERHAPE